MILSKELLTLCESSSYGYYNYTNINHDDLALLAIIHLHKQKHINDEKFLGYVRKFHNKTLIRRINTYHCKITDEWFNDEGTFTIIMNAYNKLCNKEDLDIETALTYFNKILNRNRNFCLDFLYFQYIDPIINNFEHGQYGFKLLDSLKISSLDLISYEDFENTWEATSGYCCKDCDGCFGEYKRSRYRSRIGYNATSKFSEVAKKFLNDKKTISGLKNPKNKLV